MSNDGGEGHVDLLTRAAQYASGNLSDFFAALWIHLALVGIAVVAGAIIGIPFGILTSKRRIASLATMGFFNGLRVIPTLAVLFLLIPYLGLSLSAAAVALSILAVPPILINVDAAMRSVDPAIRESAAGMGMPQLTVIRSIEIPLALPLIIAGVRTATVESIASATLAAFVGAGGLGVFVVRGFALYDPAIMLVGAVPVALMAIASERLLAIAQRRAEARARLRSM